MLKDVVGLPKVVDDLGRMGQVEGRKLRECHFLGSCRSVAFTPRVLQLLNYLKASKNYDLPIGKKA